MHRIDTTERRARLARRHHLAAPGPDVETVVADLVGLHSSDPATVYLAAWARLDPFEAADLQSALYDRRTVVRMLGMRRTMFVVPSGFAAAMDAACTRAHADRERRRLARFLEEQGVAADGPAWVDRVCAATLDALRARGEATATELRDDVPELAEKLRFGEGTSYAGTVGVSTRILFLLATDGLILRGRPRGSWLSSLYRWAPTETWLGSPLEALDPDIAAVEVARAWLARFGPGTLTDLQWWTGWTKTLTRRALAALGAAEVALEDGTGYLLAGDLEAGEPAGPWVALLPGLDPTMMGWKERAWYLGEHTPELFDRNGNAGPTVWVDGRVVGGWAQHPGGEIRFELLERIGRARREEVASEAARLEAWLGDIRVTPRFRTPLERRLLD